MGLARIQIFILDSEPGTSLKAAGWIFDGVSRGGDWNAPSRGNRRGDKKIEGGKQRWAKAL